MLKKAITLFVAIAYLVLTSGVVVDMHYCMGKLASVEFKQSAGKACERCGMQGNDCCRDEFKVVKLDDSHQQTFLTASTELVQTPVIILAQLWQNQAIQERPTATSNALSPPDLFPRSALPLLCVFRI